MIEVVSLLVEHPLAAITVLLVFGSVVEGIIHAFRRN